MDGVSPLHRAIREDHLELMRLLLQTNTHSSSLLGQLGQTPLVMAKVAAGAQDPLERTRAKILAAVKIRQMSKHA